MATNSSIDAPLLREQRARAKSLLCEKRENRKPSGALSEMKLRELSVSSCLPCVRHCSALVYRVRAFKPWFVAERSIFCVVCITVIDSSIFPVALLSKGVLVIAQFSLAHFLCRQAAGRARNRRCSTAIDGSVCSMSAMLRGWRLRAARRVSARVCCVACVLTMPRRPAAGGASRACRLRCWLGSGLSKLRSGALRGSAARRSGRRSERTSVRARCGLCCWPAAWRVLRYGSIQCVTDAHSFRFSAYRANLLISAMVAFFGCFGESRLCWVRPALASVVGAGAWR